LQPLVLGRDHVPFPDLLVHFQFGKAPAERGPVARVANDPAAGPLLERGRGAGVVGVAVGEDDADNRPARGRGQEIIRGLRIGIAGVHQNDLLPAQQVEVGDFPSRGRGHRRSEEQDLRSGRGGVHGL